MRDRNHHLGSFKNADLASLIFRSGNTVYLTLVKIQYHHSIACPWKHGWFRSISVVMVNVINIITISWQPLYANLAPLSIWYFSKRRHSNARPRKHGYRHQNYVPKCTRNEVMLKWSKWHIFRKKYRKIKKIKNQKNRFQISPKGTCVSIFKTIGGLVWPGAKSETYIHTYTHTSE